MNTVDREYLKALDAMSGAEKLRRTCGMYGAMREMLALQERNANARLTQRDIDIRVARRMYLSDPNIQRLLDRLETDHG